MEPHQVDGRTVAYIAHLSGGGFCLCGADELVLPVYYYCPRGTYDPDNRNYDFVLREINERRQYLYQLADRGDPKFHSYSQQLQERADLWATLISGRVPRPWHSSRSSDKADPDSMLIDFTARWHQGSPFNDQCPELTPGEERTSVGAAALAMSQIMYYWQWPFIGEGNSNVDYEYRWSDPWLEWALGIDPGIPSNALWENRLEWTADEGGKLRMRGYWDPTLLNAAEAINADPSYHHALDENWKNLTKINNNYSVDFSTQSYDWTVLEDIHSAMPSLGSAEAAKICYHAGIAAETNYGIQKSDASSGDVKYAFKDHFRYDPDVREEGSNLDHLTEEIQWYRPVAVKGDDPVNGTHIWIFYGYNNATDPNRQFLTNMGYGGTDDGWYSYDGVGGFTSGQREIRRIAPETVVQFVYQNISKSSKAPDGSPDNPYTSIDEALAAAPDSVTLIFKAGTNMPLTGDTLVIDRPMVLKGQMVLGEKP
jgi:hypothetical protein